MTFRVTIPGIPKTNHCLQHCFSRNPWKRKVLAISSPGRPSFRQQAAQNTQEAAGNSPGDQNPSYARAWGSQFSHGGHRPGGHLMGRLKRTREGGIAKWKEKQAKSFKGHTLTSKSKKISKWRNGAPPTSMVGGK